MPVFFNLRGQCAAPGRVATAGQRIEGIDECSVREPIPLDRRISIGLRLREQLAVLDVKQAFHQDRRDVFKVFKNALWVTRLK